MKRLGLVFLALAGVFTLIDRSSAEHPRGAANADGGVLPARPAAPKPRPPREPNSCDAKGRPITAADAVYSEWGTIPNQPPGGGSEYIRIVKNQATRGYALWYCNGSVPSNASGPRNFGAAKC